MTKTQGGGTGAAVGIDLGTTQSVIAHVAPSGAPAVIPSVEGSPTTPSIVLFDHPGHVVVGAPARSALATEPELVVQLVKRRMGSEWVYEYEGVAFRAEHISALILRKLVMAASRVAGPVGSAVVTVPAYFDDTRRLATRAAAEMAGLEVLGLLAEPTAAAIAFGYERRPDPKVGIVVDLGGGTFDVTVLEYAGEELTVRAVGGDSYLGGANFDKVLYDHFVAAFAAEHDFDLNDPEALSIDELTLVSQDWLTRAAAAKHDLSSRTRTTVLLQAAGMSLALEVSRATFEQLSAVLLEEISGKTIDVLSRTGLRREDIGVVLSVGGSSRIPAVQARFADLLGRQPDVSVPPDEAVALGAAIFAARLRHEAGDGSGVPEPMRRFVDNLKVADVSAHGIGVGTVDGSGRQVMTVVLPPSSRLGAAPRSKRVFTVRPDETRVVVPLMEGDEADFATRIGQVVIDDLPGGRPPGQAIDVSIGYDNDGILRAAALDMSTGKRAEVRIERSANTANGPAVDAALRAVQAMEVS